MKVRAKQDGVYGGYYRTGPANSDEGFVAGEVFEIDEKPFAVLDAAGNPVPELDEKGKPIMDKNGKPKFKMATWFSSEWMERVPEETPVTNDYPPFQIPVQYREKKVAPAPGVPTTLKQLDSVI